MKSTLKNIFQYFLVCLFIVFALATSNAKTPRINSSLNKTPISKIFAQYYDDFIRIFPLTSTEYGETLYNDLYPNFITYSYRDTIKVFYIKYLDLLKNYDRNILSENDKISYDILKWNLEINLEALKFPEQLTPIRQFWSSTNEFAQLGSGEGNQPFKTVKDYDDFLQRMAGFKVWCDTAIANMKIGIKIGYTNPKIIMERTLPQLQSMIDSDVIQSNFYKPIVNIPKGFSASEKSRLDSMYKNAITKLVIPAYKELYDFIKDEYIPKCRTSAGIDDLPNGRAYYNYLIKYNTETNLTSDSIFEIGLSEVARIHKEMEKVKDEMGFTGSFKDFFSFLRSDKKYYPFETAEKVLDSFRTIQTKIAPQLKKLFSLVPKTKFEIRETEKYREASATFEYSPGSSDGVRPGILYVPIPNVNEFSTFSMESLFLHEAIPGHHYQMSLKQENNNLYKFRKLSWNNAYTEGWGLYTESLGKELGLYTDPYQYFSALSGEMHRALRLVIDVGIHSKGWTREQAIEYSLENEGKSEKQLSKYIERYMAVPGQALSYKIGQLKILELRNKAEKELGSKFEIKKFHDAILSQGCLPLSILENYIDNWIGKQKH